MKKAFTLSEVLITLAIIGVLAAILVPTINNVKPDKDKVTYKKALYNLQSAISSAMDSSLYQYASNSAAYWRDENVEDSDFCKSVADSLNTKGKVDCENSSSYTSPNFVTTDGIKYWNLEKGFKETTTDEDGNEKETLNDYRTIHVDRSLSAGEKRARNRARKYAGDTNTNFDEGLRIRVRYDGKVMTPNTDNSEGENASEFNYENLLIENSFNMTNTKQGETVD